jgi:hypothetical protein
MYSRERLIADNVDDIFQDIFCFRFDIKKIENKEYYIISLTPYADEMVSLHGIKQLLNSTRGQAFLGEDLIALSKQDSMFHMLEDKILAKLNKYLETTFTIKL